MMILATLGLIFGCRKLARKEAKRTMYSYRIVSIIGVIVFLAVNLILQVFRLGTFLRYPEYADIGIMYNLVSDVTNGFMGILFLAFIPVILFSVFLLVANIVLFLKEGVSLRNTLGILLGAALVAGTFGIINLYNMLDLVFNVHSYAGYCLELGIENVFAILFVYFECMMIATIYASVKSMRHKATFDKNYVVVLGCYVRPDGMPGEILRKRIEVATDFIREQKKVASKIPCLVFSGGKGSDEVISEAAAMENYVLFRKYKDGYLIEDKSKTTMENFKFSKTLIKKNGGNLENVAFATTDFHVFRSGVIASKQGFLHPEGIGAKSPWYFYYNALIREFVANLNAERKMHILNVLVLSGAMSGLILFCFMFNLL